MRFLQYENRICGECGKFCKVLEIGYRNAKRKEVGGRQRLAQICDISCIREEVDEKKVVDMMNLNKPTGALW